MLVRSNTTIHKLPYQTVALAYGRVRCEKHTLASRKLLGLDETAYS